MNTVERVKSICKERKIPIYKLEKDLGFANGYIGQLKKGALPDDRLAKVAAYLGVSVPYLIGSPAENKKSPSSEEEGLSGDAMEAAILFDRAEPWMRRQVLELLRAAESHRAAPGDDPTAE